MPHTTFVDLGSDRPLRPAEPVKITVTGAALVHSEGACRVVDGYLQRMRTSVLPSADMTIMLSQPLARCLYLIFMKMLDNLRLVAVDVCAHQKAGP